MVRAAPAALFGGRLSDASARIVQGELLVWATFALAVTLRFLHYAANRSLWLDEAMLAINIADHPMADLGTAMEFHQAAPLGFLISSRFAVLIFGVSEYSLRLVPFVASLASIPLFWRFAARRLDRPAALFALATFALSPGLIYFSAEVKPYGLDVLCALLVFWANDRVAEERGRARLSLALIGAGCVWLSHAAVFVLAGIAAVEGVAALRARDGKAVLWRSAIAAAWLSSLGLAFYASMQTLARSDLLHRFWSEGFMPFPPQSWIDLLWLPRALAEPVLDLYQLPAGPSALGSVVALLAFGLLMVGAMEMGRRRRRELALLVAPILFALIASALWLYPFRGRLVLAFVPASIVLIAAGLEAAARCKIGSMSILAGALGCALLAAPASVDGAWLASPGREELKPVLQQMVARAGEGAQLYVHSGAQHAYRFYVEHGDGCDPVGARVTFGGFFLATDGAEIEAELHGLLGQREVWILFGHSWWAWGNEQQRAMLDYLDGHGIRRDQIEARGASAYRYDLRAPRS